MNLREHAKRCKLDTFEALDVGCMARGTDYRVKCQQCGEVFVVGKHPGRREYFVGTDAEYVKGTILEE